MKNLQNLHTHTTFADGVDTPEEMVLAAIEKGFDSIGFSEHSYTSYSDFFSFKPSMIDDYKAEINRLKKKYDGEIDIFLGLEFDMFSTTELTGFDYLIGSVHYLKYGEIYPGFDRSADIVQGIIDEHFSGNGLAFAKEYYRFLAMLPQYGNFDIIGHMDLITKNCEIANLFDYESKEYKNAAFEAIDALSGKVPFFEVNTGAISRGYRTTPYPMISLIKELKRKNFGAIISSDCHDARYLDTGFSLARDILAECGFKERYILKKDGFCAVEL